MKTKQKYVYVKAKLFPKSIESRLSSLEERVEKLEPKLTTTKSDGYSYVEPKQEYDGSKIYPGQVGSGYDGSKPKQEWCTCKKPFCFAGGLLCSKCGLPIQPKEDKKWYKVSFYTTAPEKVHPSSTISCDNFEVFEIPKEECTCCGGGTEGYGGGGGHCPHCALSHPKEDTKEELIDKINDLTQQVSQLENDLLEAKNGE